jgi:GPH family glycoside/pentoside/hexuronide:cation symporter
LENKKQLSSRNLWGFALGAIPNALLAFIFGLKYIEFFFDKLQLDPTLFVIGQVIYMVINAVNDPLLGQMSDRTNPKKWGSRRTIYIRYGAPIWAITFLLVWFPWSFTDQIIIFLHFVLSTCLFDTFLTLVVLVWGALLPEMTSDLDERNKANLFTALLGAIFTIPFFLIIGPLDPTSSEFLFLMIIIAVLSTILLVLVSFLCKEKPEFQKDEGLPLIKAVKETLRNKSFLVYIGYVFCDNFLAAIGLSYLFVYLMVLGEGGLLAYFAIFFFVGYGSNILCMKLRSKWGMYKIIMTFGVLKVILGLIFFLLVILIDVPLLVIIGLAMKTFFNGYTIFKSPLLYLSIDEDELKTGSRREGMFMGINALIHKPALSLGPIVATFILGVFGYIQDTPASHQPFSAFIGIKVLMFLVPAIVGAMALIFINFYPLHGEKLAEMRKKLQELHMEKRGRIE